MTIGEKIKFLRLQANLTLEQVAEKVGVGKSTVRKWETGIIANMKGDKIGALAKALNTTPAYLIGWDTENNKSLPEEKTLGININALSPAKIQLIQAIQSLSDKQVASLLPFLETFHQ